MEIGLLEVDLEDRIVSVNQSFCKLTGYSELELLGEIAHEILANPSDSGRIEQINETRRDGKSSIYEIECRTKSGEYRNMLISGGPNRDINGKVIGSIGLHLDITRLKELEVTRETLISDLSVSNEELRNYAHVVSHDLKTPLRSIAAGLAWLKEDNAGVFDDISQSYLKIIEDSLLKMDKIISDTLKYSELKHSARQFEVVDLNKLISQLFGELQQTYPDVKFTIEGKLPELTFNEIQLMQIFQNLLDNACKYRDAQKESYVSVTCTEIVNEYEFHISDNGIGIPESASRKVFEIFQKLNNYSESNGIGLAITKKIIETAGGKIWFESEPEKGTIFKFRLPKTGNSY
jgi:PAS domain S-box-containing protein